MTNKITDRACYRTINMLMHNAGLVAVSHSNVEVNGRKMGCTGFWKNPETNKLVYITTDMLHASYGNVLIRTAKDDHDWTGGYNNYAKTKDDLIHLAQTLTK